MDALENALEGEFKLTPGAPSLWDQSIPSTLYRNTDNEWGEWRVASVNGITFKGKQGVLVQLTSSDGDVVEGLASPGPFAATAAICDGLDALSRAQVPDYRIPAWDFDLIADWVEGLMA